MSTLFPVTIDTFTNPSASDKVSIVSHSSQHGSLNDAVEALEAKVGVDSSAVATSLDYLIKNTSSKLGKIASLAVTDGNIIVGDGTNWVAESGATARISLGLAIGTNVQAYNSNLTGINQALDTTASPTFAGATINGGIIISGTEAGNLIASIINNSATGYGMRIQNGLDAQYALGILNAAGNSINIMLYGDGVIDCLGVYKVDGVQVVSNRVIDARCDDAINSGDATTDGVIDSLRDAMIAHGLIAAA